LFFHDLTECWLLFPRTLRGCGTKVSWKRRGNWDLALGGVGWRGVAGIKGIKCCTS